MVVLSAGSDGIDGNSAAAGAIADATTVARSQAMGIDAASALDRFDAYPLFTALGDTLVTGPTHNNLRDLRILLTSQSFPATNAWVPHISLVFREMWDSSEQVSVSD